MEGGMVGRRQSDGADDAVYGLRPGGADKEKVEYDWISPANTTHLFHATPKNPAARLTVRATDRFGHIYEAQVGKAMQ